MTTNPTRPRPDVLQATQLGDGTYLVRSAVCCRPEACAPAVGARCCLSPYCDCPIPVRWLRDPEKTPRASQKGLRLRDRSVRFPVYVTGAVIATGALGGIAWGVFQAVAWVVEHAILILGLGVMLAIPVLFLRPSGTFSGTFRGRMD